MRPLNHVAYRSVAPQRFNIVVLGVFSGLALLLAASGIHGVLSYSMSCRTAEIGLRVALRRVVAARYFTTLLFGIKHLMCWRTLR